MEIKSKFDHFNINVTNLERSIAFYEKALGLKEHHRKEASDGSFTLVYLTDNETGFLLRKWRYVLYRRGNCVPQNGSSRH